MWMLAAALIAAQGDPGPSESRVMPDRQAQAMVRIVSAAVVDFGVVDLGGRSVTSGESSAQARQTELHFKDGSIQPAKLLEFQ
jgi:hypothetical protein